MKKILLSAGALFFCFTLNAQLTYVGNNATVTVLNNTLVYNGGGLQAAGNGKINNSGNIMLVTTNSTDKFETVGATNFFLKYTSPTNYGQLYIDGFAQSALANAVVNKEYKDVSQGSYQQIGIPYLGMGIGNYGQFFGKTFNNRRYTLDEILKYNNTTAVSETVDVYTTFTGGDGTGYYMLGAKNIDFSASAPGALPFTLKGQPYANGQTATLQNAPNNGSFFGSGGNNLNIYNEKYNSYLQDPFVTVAWSAGYATNTYQYANPYFTNLDLNDIGLNSTNSDGVYLTNLVGIVKQPSAGKVTFSPAVGSQDTQQNKITFVNGMPPSGDVDNLILKPLETFTVKLSSAAPQTLNFDKLRRFKFTGRATTTPYSVTAAKNGNSTLKQLGVIALDAEGKEVGRTYYVVYNNAVNGHNDNYSAEATAASVDAIGTFEENASEGGVDSNYANKYWLYINEANEETFKGKAIPMTLFNPAIKSLKFEVRENAVLVPNGTTNLSAGEGFFYKAANGTVQEIAQDAIVSADSENYSLFYGKPSGVLATDANSTKASRTQVVYNPSIDDYIVRFDSNWNKADVKVFDMSGKLVISRNNVSTKSDFVINLAKGKQAYVVTATSEKGVVATAKIVR